MFNLAPDLAQGETILDDYPATVYTIQNGSASRGMNTRVYLTNQRLYYKGVIGMRPATLPLYTITSVSEEKHSLYNMVHIDFNSGHSEFMTVRNQPQFIQALNAARGGAPVIAAAPPPAGAIASSSRPAIIIFVIAFAAIAFCGISMVGGVVIFSVLMAAMRLR